MVKVLSVLCARAGSKGLSNKCVVKINDKMVVEYAIEYSISLGSNVKTIVSTDIKDLIEYCNRRHMPYIKRDSRFCADESKIDDALADASESNGQDCEYCSLVYGNIPTRYPALFYEALNFMQENNDYDSVISMQNVEKFHPEWMFDYNEEVLPLAMESHYRRQSLPQKMIHDGHTLIFKKDEFLRRYRGELPYDKKIRYSIFGTKFKPLINDEVIVDIDTKKDLILAEALLNNRSIYYKS